LNHETGEALKGTGNPDRWADFNEHAFRCGDVDLKPPGFVDRGVQESKEALPRDQCHVDWSLEEARFARTNLMRDIWSSITDIAVHLPHDTDVFVTVEQRVLLIFQRATSPTMRCSVGLQASIGQNHYQALGIFIG